MLDSSTKARIDALRDTLVGKLPVPTEQVKQITLGLMYKFMGDLDEEYAKLGSKPFFAGEYEDYAWKNIMALTEAPKRAELYAAGLEKTSLKAEGALPEVALTRLPGLLECGMPRITRTVIAGMPLHVTQRGHRRENVFFADSDLRPRPGQRSEKGQSGLNLG